MNLYFFSVSSYYLQQPENLLLTKDGHLKVADFGSAKALGTFSNDLIQNLPGKEKTIDCHLFSIFNSCIVAYILDLDHQNIYLISSLLSR
jgi:serine/threonine protein kinase